MLATDILQNSWSQDGNVFSGQSQSQGTEYFPSMNTETLGLFKGVIGVICNIIMQCLTEKFHKCFAS